MFGTNKKAQPNTASTMNGRPETVIGTNTSIVEGSIGAIPRRLMVEDRHHFAACAALVAAERERP